MARFRGAPLTHETAEGIFIGWATLPYLAAFPATAGRRPGTRGARDAGGRASVGACARRWLGQDEWSWRVVAGQNAAYGEAPCLNPCPHVAPCQSLLCS
jgi:hypothetical protein